MAFVNGQEERSCWITLLTDSSYLPGVIILAYTLDKHMSKYPLIVQFTSSLGEKAMAALLAEASLHGRIIPQHVELLLPPAGNENTSIVAERFRDTLTKLRAFEVYRQGFTRAVFLDADMAIFRYPDGVFETKLPGRDWLGANHACVCNLDRDEWAPADWQKGNCAYTALESPLDVALAPNEGCRTTYRLLNGGMFLFYPSEKLWQQLLNAFNTSDRVKLYQFPDQDFLADFYRDKWQPVSWKYNAIKTMRYWHPRVWDDKELVIVHYIIDKPWERAVSSEGIAGHLGRDGETHQWWWNLFDNWKKRRVEECGNEAAVEQMHQLVGHEKPFIKVVPLAQEPGNPEDVLPYP